MSDDVKAIKIYRNKLYEQIWKVPISRLAPEYGLSDVGLSKICRKLKVPKPPRGYWTKLQFKKKVVRTPLPKLNPGDQCTYTIHFHSSIDKKAQPESTEKGRVINEYNIKNRITVPKSLKSPHLLVKKTKEILKEISPDEYGVLRPWRKNCLNIRVSPRSLNRALRIMDTLIKELELKRFQVFSESGEASRLPCTYVEIFGEKIFFLINEKVKRVEHVPTKKEIKRQEKYSWARPRCWDYIPTGKLSLIIEVWGAYGLRKKWSDTSSECVEDNLDDFVIMAIRIAELLRKERLEREEEERKKEEEQRKLAEEKRRRKEEEERLLALEKQAEQWAKSQQLREYIQAVQRTASAQKCSNDFQKQIERWLSWAREHADRIDPLKKGLPFKDDKWNSDY
jgi:hypothetical protein